MKETSVPMKSAWGSSAVRISVCSIETTLGSLRRNSASWSRPTSTAYTFAAPCWSMQSVNPPVEDPMSMHSAPVISSPNCSSAASSFSPPLPA